MTTQLFIYNEALGHLGERQLASLAEPREPRRVLDSYWSDVVGFCLSQGLWKFAKRTVQIDNDASVTPQFGFNYCFPIPRIGSEQFSFPLRRIWIRRFCNTVTRRGFGTRI